MKNNNEESPSVDSGIPDSAFAKVSEQVRIQDDDYFSYYANSVAVNMSAWDISIIFGEILGVQDGKPVIEESVKILMTRETAKALNKILTAQLDMYEKEYGIIRIPVPVRLHENKGTKYQGEIEEK